ncbi:ATP-binding cassette domain-containing protein [Roseisalinus antarcticus]|uniref:Toxin RTX-I translocation ATP-binding protein n=1 Tax=Roseisalinus antarcticus TaxID=254357 RepID=A0A1Y5SHY9_9RHOB|nr:ATP-binding cassette domain-containing protein [Roseisalinus antarcticus]SLN39575.1 Toxin RTX-I translocation ATP-binding protein [Roseisalinus antarcticus]
MSGPVIAFDVNASRSAATAPVVDASRPPEPRQPPAPETAAPAPAEARHSERTRHRADLGATFAAWLGVAVVRSDLLERMGLGPDQDAGPADLAHALSGAGLTARLKRGQTPAPALWPALAEMTSGQLLLVLAQQDDTLLVYDTTCKGNQAEVPLADFAPHFTGTLVCADLDAAELARRHGGARKAPHWFWGEMKGLRRHLGEVALGSFVANLLAVAVALFSLQIYDRVIPHQSISTLWVLAIGAGLALMLEAALRIARSRLMDGAGRKIELRIQSLLMERLLGMRRGIEGQSASGTFSAVREFGAIREFFTASTIGSLTDLPFIFLFLALVASIGGPVVWVLVAGGVLMVLPSFLVRRRMMRLTKETQGASSRTNRLLHEVIYEADTIKAHRGEDRFRQVWSEVTALNTIATSEQRKLAANLTFWAQGVQQATYVSAVVAGTYLVFAGDFTVGTIIAVGILTSRTLGPLTQLAGTLARWSNVRAALEALDAVAMAPQDHQDGRAYLRRESLTGAYELREVGFQYDEDSGQSLDLPGLRILPGQRVAVLGPNGSGKSTLLKLLSGLYRPGRGRVLIDGVDMGQVMPRDLRRGIGYLGQDVRLFAGTLRENLNLTLLERDDDRLMAALDFAGLGAFVRTHPKGLDLMIRDGGEGLSNGQRQSIGWARLWLQDPAVCLLDEPTAALDQTLEATLVARLDAWLEGRTAVIATHRVPILSLCGRTIILQQGRLAVDGPREEVLAHLKARKGGA